MMHCCNGTCPMYDAENGECCATDEPRISVKPDAECFFDAYELDNPFVPPKPTNADRIRSMSDEELADWIDSVLNQDREDWNVPGCYSCINYGTHHSDPQNKGTYLYECAACPHEGSYENGLKYGVLAWLQQPAKEEHHEDD